MFLNSLIGTSTSTVIFVSPFVALTLPISTRPSDARVSSWLALYNLNSPTIGTSDAYKVLATKGSDREKALIPPSPGPQPQHPLAPHHPDTTTTALPSKHITIVSMQLGDTRSEDEFNAWYDEEHIQDFHGVPGYLRVRCYKLLSNIQLVGKRKTDEPVHTFWAIYDVNRNEWDKAPKLRAASATPATKKILSQIKAISICRFVLHTNFPKPGSM